MQLLVGNNYPYDFTQFQISMDNYKKNYKGHQSDEDLSPKDTPPKKRKGSGEQRSESEKKALHRERVRINEQKRRERVKDYFATLKELLPKDQQNSEMTKEEILLQAIQMLQEAKQQQGNPSSVRSPLPDKSRLSPVPQTVSLSHSEISDTYMIIHRDVYQKLFNLNTPSSLHSAIGLCSYLVELAQRSLNPVYLLHAQTSQVLIYTFVSFNPAICLSIFDTLIPLYEQLTEGDTLVRIEPPLGCSEWVLPVYSLVLSSLGKFDKAMAIEKRALDMAAKHPEVAGVVFACLYFIRQFRGETLTISESLDACKSMKMFPQYNSLANLTFGLSLLQQGKSVQDRMEAKAIIEQSEDAVNSGPYFDSQARVMLIESSQYLNPTKALREIEDSLLNMEKGGKTGCFTKADFLRMKADTLLRMRQDSVEEYMLSQMAAEGLYQEALSISASLGLFSCTLKCVLSLCKMFKVQGRSELSQMGHYLLQLVIKLEKETTQPSSLMIGVKELLSSIVKIEIV